MKKPTTMQEALVYAETIRLAIPSKKGSSIPYLQAEAEELGLTVTPSGNRVSKSDYHNAIAQHYLKLEYPNKKFITKALKARMAIESPMLAARYQEVKPQVQDDIFNGTGWWLTQKEDGVRMVMYYFPSEGLSMFSRNISSRDYLPIEYGANLCNTMPPGAFPHPFIVDCEIISTNPFLDTTMGGTRNGTQTKTQLQAVAALLAMNPEDAIAIQQEQMIDKDTPLLEFRVIDVLLWDDRELMEDTYEEREALFDPVVKTLKPFVNLQRIAYEKDPAKKLAFHNSIIDAKGEGTVAVKIDTPYNATPTRKKDGFVKIKKSVSGALALKGMGDTIDGWVTGFSQGKESNKGMIGHLDISCHLINEDGSKEIHKVAVVGNFTKELRRKMSVTNPDGTASLREEYYGRVVEVDGMGFSSKSRRVTHSKFLGWRPDKPQDECYVTEEFIAESIV